MRARDRQQKRVYKWEGEWGRPWNRKTLTQDQCREVIAAACEWYSIPMPTLRFLVGRRGWTFYDPNDHSINLRQRHMNVAVCLHETAHAIHSHVTGDEDHEIHGPEWLAIYLWLLRRAEVASETALTKSVEAYGLSYGDLDRHSPRRLRATYRTLFRRVEAAREVT
jgi:hypothetical protein